MDAPGQRHIFTVSELNRDVRSLLESGFPGIWLEGEISNFSAPFSGHWYFSLKDAQAQVRCAMFKNRNYLVDFEPEQGMHVVIRAKVGLYEPRGEYQLIAEHMEQAGDGALQRAFEELKKRLDKEGLFAAQHKQAIPRLAKQVAVITSATGAAIRDILSTINRRFPALPIVIYPVPVQGEEASRRISKAIAVANQRQECDVIILARGGGSLEDLWAFNEELTAYAIYESKIPIISAIGHEVDFTIADFVADFRAPTPTAAAELVSPDMATIIQSLDKNSMRLQQIMRNRLQQNQQNLHHLSQRLQHPSQKLHAQTERLTHFVAQLNAHWRQHLQNYQQKLANLQSAVMQAHPQNRIKHYQQHCHYLSQQLLHLNKQYLQHAQDRLAQNARTLDAVSPLATLQRGYSIACDHENNIIRSSKDLKLGDQIDLRFAAGQATCEVKEIARD
ncbi:MAG: exodeoxyribonuclease VII large subunit [Gammaproteobacteria bacterium]|nr:exodeoxyribonuclease VII large subunit [Gammaproteobacteria bacterium]